MKAPLKEGYTNDISPNDKNHKIRGNVCDADNSGY